MSVDAPGIAAFAIHGGRLDAARAAYPGRADWIDLSTGLSPWSYPATVDAASFERLPEAAALAGLEAAAAKSFGAAEVVAVPGTDLALRLLGRRLGGRVAVVGPGYSGHVAMWRTSASLIDAGAIVSAATTHDVIVLSRPNNPDGTVIDRDVLAKVAKLLAARGGHLIVDEAFVDATPEASVVGSGWPGLIVLRSFGKFFGLAGLRLGFVVAPSDVAADLRQMLGDWPVSGAAIAVGTAAYADRDWQAAQRERLAVGARRLDALLASAGLKLVGGTSCFRLVQTPERDALFDHLARAAILTRPFADQPLRLRLGLPGEEPASLRLTEALKHWRRR